jgi:hypothetical protein
MAGDGSTLAERVSAVSGETLDSTVEWTIEETSDGCRVGLPDRELGISARDGPGTGVYWVLSLQSGGATVSKFGPYESMGGLVEQFRTLLTADVQYTVCCDG